MGSTLLNYLKIIWNNQIKFKLFNNYLSLTTNFLHIINSKISKLVYKKNFDTTYEENNIQYKNLKEKGFVIQKNSFDNNLKELSKIISKKFDEKKNLIYNDDYISYLNPKILDHSKLLSVFNKNLINLIKSFYNSDFQIYAYHIYRVEENNRNDKFSHLWHVDNSTKHSLKLMFYLDEAKIDSGAMLILPKKKSKVVFSEGNYNRNDFQSSEFKFIRDIEYCEGKIGDYLVFQNSLCLHKINRPKNYKRDVININVYPSFKKFDIKNIDLNNYFFNSGFAINPFNNLAQNKIKNEKIQ